MKKLTPFAFLILFLCFAAMSAARPLKADGDCAHPSRKVEVTVPPTCTAGGESAEVCMVCGEILDRQSLPPTGHRPTEIAAVPATCTTGGFTAGTECAICGEILTAPQPTDPAGHTEESIPAVPATCTKTGLTEGTKCAVCGEILSAPQETALAAHTPEVIPAVPAACTTGGLTEGTKCAVCGEILTAPQPTDPAGHTPEVIPAVPATCTKTGLTEGTKCAVCGEILSAPRTTALAAHTEETIPAVPAACLNPGMTEGTKCAVCGKTLTAPRETPALGHDFTGYRETTPATWRAPGVETDACSRCGETRTRPIPLLTHLPDADCPTGDADMDGKVTATDARFVLRMAVGFDDGLDAAQQVRADLDGDGKVTAADARGALRLSVGLPAFTPALLPGYTFVGYTGNGYPLAEKDGVTYVVTKYGYTLIANKTYSLPASYAPGDLTPECYAAFQRMEAGAAADGISLWIVSGYRSYYTQESIYNRYVAADGRAAADTYSARPGHSEHQSGLAMDLNSLSGSFAYTPAGRWLANNAHRYGFIIRYGATKQAITGYIYEPWHVRYLGTELAAEVYNSGLCLEEFFGITSYYH